MKGLDFASFAQQATADEDEDEDEDEEDDDGEDEDEEDEDDDEEEEDEDDEDEDEDEEEDVAEAEVKAPTSATLAATKKDAVASAATIDTPASRIDDPSPESATVGLPLLTTSVPVLTHCRRCQARDTGQISFRLSRHSLLLWNPSLPSSSTVCGVVHRTCWTSSHLCLERRHLPMRPSSTRSLRPVPTRTSSLL